jgi:catechol 2,3-dioxygenase-like lactoylglutathione lyase family enzyme
MTLTQHSTCQVVVISVPVSDQERAKAFYVDQLGFELLRDDSSVPGLRWIQVAPPGGGPSLTLVDWFDTMAPGSLRGLVFQVTDIDAEYERLVANGVQFEGPPERQPWATEAVFLDPDGNGFVLQAAE